MCLRKENQKSSTLTHAAALLPRARWIPHKLLPLLLDGNTEGISDVRIIQVSHTQNLRWQEVHKACKSVVLYCRIFLWSIFLSLLLKTKILIKNVCFFQCGPNQTKKKKKKLMHKKIFRWFPLLSCHAGWPRPQWNLIGLKTAVVLIHFTVRDTWCWIVSHCTFRMAAFMLFHLPATQAPPLTVACSWSVPL